MRAVACPLVARLSNCINCGKNKHFPITFNLYPSPRRHCTTSDKNREIIFFVIFIQTGSQDGDLSELFFLPTSTRSQTTWSESPMPVSEAQPTMYNTQYDGMIANKFVSTFQAVFVIIIILYSLLALFVVSLTIKEDIDLSFYNDRPSDRHLPGQRSPCRHTSPLGKPSRIVSFSIHLKNDQKWSNPFQSRSFHLIVDDFHFH